MTPPPVLLENVSAEYPSSRGSAPVRVFDAVDLTLGEREFLAIVGPSGCGKSTVLKIVSGLLPPALGRVLIDGEPIAGTPPGIGFMFQRDALLPWRSVAGNIAIGLELAGVPKAAWADETQELLRLVGLEGLDDRFPSSLSGGMRQRVSLARTLAYKPRILLMDEPFGALDAQTKVIMGQELLRIWQRERQSAIFVTHDIEEAATLADRVLVMSSRPGRVKAEYRIDAPRPRDSRSLRRSSEFAAICEQIWDDLTIPA